MTATVKEQVNHFSGETKGWNHPERIEVIQDNDTTSNWNEGDTYERPCNSFIQQSVSYFLCKSWL